MIRLIALLWCLLPIAALSQPYPALHDVTGVAADDVLNVRERPDAASAIIGALAPDTPGVEVVRTDASERWGLVNIGEGAGWAAMRYLAPQPPGDYTLTRILLCSGTEPFWDLTITQGSTAQLRNMSGPDEDFSVGVLQRAYGRSDRYSLHGHAANSELAVVIRHQACNDGMSDREFGLDTDLLITGQDGPFHLSGCCTLIGD